MVEGSPIQSILLEIIFPALARSARFRSCPRSPRRLHYGGPTTCSGVIVFRLLAPSWLDDRGVAETWPVASCAGLKRNEMSVVRLLDRTLTGRSTPDFQCGHCPLGPVCVHRCDQTRLAVQVEPLMPPAMSSCGETGQPRRAYGWNSVVFSIWRP